MNGTDLRNGLKRQFSLERLIISTLAGLAGMIGSVFVVWFFLVGYFFSAEAGENLIAQIKNNMAAAQMERDCNKMDFQIGYTETRLDAAISEEGRLNAIDRELSLTEQSYQDQLEERVRRLQSQLIVLESQKFREC